LHGDWRADWVQQITLLLEDGQKNSVFCGEIC
jgi:hypothetical protein